MLCYIGGYIHLGSILPVTCSLSIEWMRRTHAMMPLTAQEDGVRRLLIERRLSFEQHHVLDLGRIGRLSVDFLVFFGPGIVLECTSCGSKRGRALAEVRRRGAYIDYRFGLLRSAFPNLTCGALIEAPFEDPDHLRMELAKILRNSKFVAHSSGGLERFLPKVN